MKKVIFRTEESTDPEHPGKWIHASVDGVDVCCVLLELDENCIKARLWNEEHYEDDAITVEVLYRLGD